MRALALNSAGGGKTRFSLSVESISRLATETGKEDMQGPRRKKFRLDKCARKDSSCAGEASADTLSGGTGEKQVGEPAQGLVADLFGFAGQPPEPPTRSRASEARRAAH